MRKTFYLPILLFMAYLSSAMMSCNRGNGLFGHSKSKAEAKKNGSNVVEYVPNKASFNLLDGTKMTIDTAWTEISFTYKNGKRILDSTYGYHFSIPFKREVKEWFTFTFALADTTNRVFTNGMDEDLAQLCPKYLFNEMKVLLNQKNTDSSKGWTQPIVTDTITFTRVK